MNLTENYNLKKPEPTDYYNIEDFNENSDIIDEQLKENKLHRENSNLHVTLTDKDNLREALTHSKSIHAPSDAEVNQNAFSNVKVGENVISADSKTDTIELVAGSNITITPDATNDKITVSAKDTTYSTATTSANGLMSSTDKSKLDGIATGANKYTHPTHTAKSNGLYKVTVDGSGHVSGTTSVAKSDITALGIPAQDTTYSNFVKSGSSAKAGLVPAPSTTAGTTKYLREDGTWSVPPDNNTVYTHPNSGATAGTYRSVTVNAAGHVTAGSNPTITVVQGGTGATTAASARTNLGLGSAATASTTSSITSGGTGLITSGAVYTGLSGKASYETGTFTLTYKTDTSYNIGTFNYTKIGNLVIVYGSSFANKSLTASANSIFTGLPFTITAAHSSYFYFGSNMSNIPSNLVTNNTIHVSSNQIMITKEHTFYTSGASLMLFGIYLTK